MLPTGIDDLDARLILSLFAEAPAQIMELRPPIEGGAVTVQARLDKLQGRGAITGFGPDLDLRYIGYNLPAFVTPEIAQGRLVDVTEHLAGIPEVLEGPCHHRAG